MKDVCSIIYKSKVVFILIITVMHIFNTFSVGIFISWKINKTAKSTFFFQTSVLFDIESFWIEYSGNFRKFPQTEIVHFFGSSILPRIKESIQERLPALKLLAFLQFL